MLIRLEKSTDKTAIRRIHRAVFGSAVEGRIIDTLRDEVHPFISLVAERDGQLVGHIALSPLTLSGHDDVALMGLGPMAVTLEYQGQGIGSALVAEGLAHCRRHYVGAVLLVGHPDYYPRFGFTPASQYGLECELEVADDAFMALELQTGYLRGLGGTAHFHRAFGNT